MHIKWGWHSCETSESFFDLFLAESHCHVVVCVPVLSGDGLHKGDHAALQKAEVVQEHVEYVAEEVDVGGWLHVEHVEIF